MGDAKLNKLIEIENLTISYSKQRPNAVDDLTLSVSSGQVMGLLGGNGAGKTSTMKALAGIIPPTSGKVYINGFDITNMQQADSARMAIGYCPDTGGLVRQATTREHIGLALGLRNQLERWPYALDLVDRFDLTAVLDMETTGFSHGMSRRLSVLLAVLTAEKALILDEPFDGVDPVGVAVTTDLIKTARDAGLAVIVSTHLLSILAETSDQISVMVAGNLVETSDASDFRGTSGRKKYAHLLRTE
jgi:ABC-2 type transport system ATP-binding protein